MTASKQETDERLLVEAAQRDPRRFAELYELHFHRVYGYVLRRVERREEAEDITSEVFHHALAKIKSYEWRGVPFSAWLIRIAANALTDRWKKTSRESDDPVEDDLEGSYADDIEQCAALSQLVQGLPAEQKRVLILRFVEGREHQGDRQRDWQDRRRSEAITIPCPGEAAGADGGCQCLSALFRVQRNLTG